MWVGKLNNTALDAALSEWGNSANLPHQLVTVVNFAEDEKMKPINDI
ncbi:MAG: hypothetical protein ACI9C4_002573 [Paraglaciecola sp.]